MQKLEIDYAVLNTRQGIQQDHTGRNEDSGGQVALDYQADFMKDISFPYHISALRIIITIH